MEVNQIGEMASTPLSPFCDIVRLTACSVVRDQIIHDLPPPPLSLILSSGVLTGAH